MDSRRAAAVYRLILRARSEVFKGDRQALDAAALEIRRGFELVRGLARGSHLLSLLHCGKFDVSPCCATTTLQERNERDPARVQQLLQEVRTCKSVLRCIRLIWLAGLRRRGFFAGARRPSSHERTRKSVCRVQA
jgi:hypothetical protein